MKFHSLLKLSLPHRTVQPEVGCHKFAWPVKSPVLFISKLGLTLRCLTPSVAVHETRCNSCGMSTACYQSGMRHGSFKNSESLSPDEEVEEYRVSCLKGPALTGAGKGVAIKRSELFIMR